MKPKGPADIPWPGVCRIALRLGRGRSEGICPVFTNDIGGVVVQIKREMLMAACQLAGITAAALILPCSLIDLKFNTDFLGTLMQAMLAGVALR